MTKAADLLGEDRIWDAVIVGSGMGGGAVAFGLAKAGLDVLVLEKGANYQRLGRTGIAGAAVPGFQQRLAVGWWPTKIKVEQDGEASESFLPIGCGTGGSTTMYAASMERMDASDFAPGRYFPGTDSLAPDVWPIAEETLRPYYEAVERYFAVRGEPDPLSDADEGHLIAPPPLGPLESRLREDFEAAGLHPYRQHLAIRYLPGCKECIGHACPRPCKIDAANGFVDPAMALGAHVATDTTVTRVLAQGGKATGVVAEHEGRRYDVRAKTVVLAAGALFSPALLLASGDADGDGGGLANGSGLVGRGLMFHVGNQFTIWPSRKADHEGPRKSLALRDFYVRDDRKYGLVQAVGVESGPGAIIFYLQGLLAQSRLAALPGFELLLKIAGRVGGKVTSGASVYTCILEDLPYPENRVRLDATQASGIAVEYAVKPELSDRVRSFRKLLKKAFPRNRTVLIDRGVRLNTGHPSGTLKAGHDPATSVVGPDCETHDVEGLFVADSSWFPTSGGVSPSLTIAANGLRVADTIAARSGRTSDGRMIAEGAPNLLPAPATKRAFALDGAVCLVTGASGHGLGAALSKGFIEAGATVVGVGRSQGRLDEVADRLGTDRFVPIAADLNAEGGAAALATEIETRLGRLDVLVNNAAAYPRALMEDSDPEAWWAAMRTNVFVPFALSRACLPLMKKNGVGRVVFVGSNAFRFPLAGSSAYSVSKGALQTVGASFAVEVNPDSWDDLAVLEFRPPAMRTPMGSPVATPPEDVVDRVKDILSLPAGESHGRVFQFQPDAASRKTPASRVKASVKALIR